MRCFRRPRAERALTVPQKYRPELEALEDRRLMNVSSIFDTHGVLTTYIVDQSGVLTRINNHGAHVINVRPGLPGGVTVRNAHAYLDARGIAAVDVVFSDGQAWQADSRGSRLVADHALNMNTVISKSGPPKIFLVIDNTGSPPFGPGLTGNLVVRSHGVDTILDTNVRWAATFVAANGQVGLAKGKVAAGGNLVVTRKLGAVTRTLYNSPSGATQDITNYSESSFNGQTVIDITFGRFAGTYDLRFRQSTLTMLGTGTSILVGG